MISSSSQDTKNLAQDVLDKLGDTRIITLTGELGSGKTTFSQGMGQVLGVKRMVSPTYILLRQYTLPSNKYGLKTLYHADLYRVTSLSEALDLGLSEIWSQPSSLLLVEWPEKIMEVLPSSVKISFNKLSEEKRELTIEYPTE